MLPNIIIICQRTTSLYSFNYFLYLFDQFFIQIYQYGIERHTFFAIMVLYQEISAETENFFILTLPEWRCPSRIRLRDVKSAKNVK